MADDDLWYLRQISNDATREGLINAVESSVDDKGNSLQCFHVIKNYIIEHGSEEEGKQENETDAEFRERCIRLKQEVQEYKAALDAKDPLSRLLVVTHSNIVKEFLLGGERRLTSRALPNNSTQKFSCVNSELWPYKYEYYN